MKARSRPVSLGDIAKAVGVSRVAVCYALRNRPGVSRALRQRILRAARRLGYSPDAQMALAMQRVRLTKSKQLLPIAWLNSTQERDAWNKHLYLTPYLEGARARALELGYRLEEIWAREPGMTMRRISQILYQRRIEGVIVSQPARHIRLNWDYLAGVSIDGSLLVPGLPRVMSDNAYNLMIALKSLRRLGHRRIGICLSQQVDSFSDHACRSTAAYLHTTGSRTEQVPPLFYPVAGPPSELERQVNAWLKKHRPEVIVGLDNRLAQWAEVAGFRIPRQMGIVHLALDDDVSDWAGIYSNKREIGATAAEWVISLLQSRRFGLPKVAMHTLVRGHWRAGRTLGSSPR
jgi:LacI family transcriptional regulator